MYKIFILIYYCIASLFFIWLKICQFKDYFYEYSCDGYEVILPEYDYIVVGAGSAGSIVARRLAENSAVTVLLIEAGPESTVAFNVPSIAPLLQKSDFDWQHQTVPQENACLGLNKRRSTWPMGKLVGGTGVFNNLIYARGHRLDYNNWAEAGNPGWGYEKHVLNYFKKSEIQQGSFVDDVVYHANSSSGLWPVSDLRFHSAFSDAFLNASVELGHEVRDVNGDAGAGFMRPQVNVARGARFNANDMINDFAQSHRNLRLLVRAEVYKIWFKKNMEATGVSYLRFGEKHRVRCHRTVVLCAGTVGTPKILMLSGIGPRAHLENLKIPVRLDLPVGENLQDHVTTGLDLVLLNQTLSFSLPYMFSPLALFNYYLHGQGPWTFPGCEALGLVHSPLAASDLEPPDLQLMAMPAGISTEGDVQVRKAMGITDKLWSEYFHPLIGRQAVSILPVVLHPKSRGYVRLKSRDPGDGPIINPRYLSSEEDVAVLYHGIELIKKLISTKAMQSLGAELNRRPLPGCQHIPFDTVPYWDCYIRHLTITSYHPVGTCKMGPVGDLTAVVDHFLRVHGTSRLRIMDASIMPRLPSANINAAVVMIAEKGTAMLEEFWKNHNPASYPPRTNTCLQIHLFLPQIDISYA